MSSSDEEQLLLLALQRNRKKDDVGCMKSIEKEKHLGNTTASVVNCNHMKIGFFSISVCLEKVSRNCMTYCNPALRSVQRIGENQ